jgi:DNA polymerase-4
MNISEMETEDKESATRRTILHVDLDAFFCSVEILRNPTLEGVPLVVGGQPGSRGVVASASYPARKFGIRSAMPTAQALRRCPDLVIVSSNYANYSEYSQQVMDLLRESAPVVEQISIDEAFLDISDTPDDGESLAGDLQREIKSQFGLPTSWGVASSKMVAKIATEIGKPEGLVVVPSGQEAEFLAPLPVEMLWGIGPKSRERLVQVGIRRIGDINSLSSEQLIELFGARGSDLAAKAKGLDPRPVTSSHRRRSISNERTFAKDISDEVELRRIILSISENLGRRLRDKGLAGSTVRVKIRWPDFETITRQVRLDQPTDQDSEIYQAANELFNKAWKPRQKVRLLGVGVADLGKPVRQLDMFDRKWEQDDRLFEAIDEIRNKYGGQALRRASSLRNPGESKERGSGS